MTELYNIYCDESCHLENDRQAAMVLGASVKNSDLRDAKKTIQSLISEI